MEKINELKIGEAEKYLRQGFKAERRCNLKEALTFYEEAIKADSNCVDAWECRASILEDFRKYKEAQKCYKMVIKLCHKSFESLIYNGLAYISAVLKLPDKEKDKELKIFDKLLDKHPRNIELWLLKMYIVSSLFDLFGSSKALELADKVSQLFPRSRVGWRAKESFLLKLKRREELINHYDRWLEKFPNATYATYILRDKAVELKELGRYGEALACYDEYIKKGGFRGEALEGKAIVLIEARKYEDAIKLLDKRLSFPEMEYNPFVRLLKARALKGLKRYAEAIRCYVVVESSTQNDYQLHKWAVKEKKECSHKLATVKE